MAHNSLACAPIIDFGTEEQKEEYLPRMCRGAVGCFALSEPESGSDAAGIKTGAVKKGGAYILNGTKSMGYQRSRGGSRRGFRKDRQDETKRRGHGIYH